MAINIKIKNTAFGVGDMIKVHQRVKEGPKTRKQIYEGIVVSIRGRKENKSFVVRRIGVQQVGIERIFPIDSPSIEKVEVTRKGSAGIRRSKLYYLRDKSQKEIESIFKRQSRKVSNK